MVYSDGNEYVGELHDKQRSGRGSMHFTDKSLYTGAWVENKRHSSGRLSLPNGCITDLVYSHGKSFQWPTSPHPPLSPSILSLHRYHAEFHKALSLHGAIADGRRDLQSDS